MFVHLHCHSHYSFLRAIPSPEEIMSAAAGQKMPAVALTDTNGMYAALPFYLAAQKAHVKPILGVTLDVESRISHDEFQTSQHETQNSSSIPIVLLAADSAGYSNLCRLITLRKLGTLAPGQSAPANETEDDGRPVTLDELAQHSSGVIALAPINHLSSRAESRPLLPGRSRGIAAKNDLPAVSAFLASLKSVFSDRLYLEIHHLSPGDGRFLREAEFLSRELSIPLVATNNVHFLKPEEHLHHRAVNAVRIGGLLTTVKPPEITTAEAWFKSATEMQRLFPDHPELLRNTLEIASRCNLQLELNKLIFPEFPVPDGESPFSYLWKLSFEGARRLYRPLRPEVLSRLTHELEVIEKLNLAPYFLLVWDIVEEARRRGIPAVARGSAASSIVTYCLGISRVCPLRWGLYFERFLNAQRGDCPDIDIDICGARRDELLDYVYSKWGESHVAGPRQVARVAMIGSFITMHARLAIREIAKTFGVPPAEVNRFTRRLPHRPVREILQAIQDLPECRDLPINDEPWKTILQVALRLDDAPRHLGIHPCGTVISARPLAELVPLERAAKGIVVTQYDMNAVEALGLIKMDLLGQRGFTTMSLALDNIDAANHPLVVVGLQTGSSSSAKHEEPMAFATPKTNQIPVIPTEAAASFAAAERRDPSSTSSISARQAATIAPDGATPCPTARQIHFDAIPENDPATCDVIASGRTMGVFQIESPGMRGLLRTMKARTLEEIATALALIRPGASEYGSKELFLKRLRGQEPIHYAHESLKKILGDTLGVCIYQEQVMQIAQAVGSMSLAEADLVRRSAAKFSGQRERERLRAKFLKAAEQIGLAGAEREETWLMVEKFAGFGFCKAHAATYADISYRMTYLKTHHTAEFLAAMCSSGAGFYHVSAYVEEAKRWGIPVLLPSVNHSLMQYTAEPFLECGGSTPLSSSFAGPLACPERSRDAAALRVGLMPVAQPFLAVHSSEAHSAINSSQRALRLGLMPVAQPFLAVHASEAHSAINSSQPALRVGLMPVAQPFLAAHSSEAHSAINSSQRALRVGLMPVAQPFLAVHASEAHSAINSSQRALRVGLMQIRSLRLETIVNIVREREAHGLYLSLEDFLRRVPVERDEIEALIKCGAFDDVSNSTRPALLWQWNLLQEKLHNGRLAKAPSNLFGESSAPSPEKILAGFETAEYSLEQKLRYEREILEVCVSGHPLDFLPRHGEAWSDELPALCGKRVTLCGWVVTYRHVGTKNYRNMMFVTLEDQRGVYEAVLFPEAYERYGGLIFETRALRVTGRVEPDGQLNCERMEALAKTPPAVETANSKSHCC